MPKDEVDMMQAALMFLRDHNDPPAVGTEEAVRFRTRAEQKIGAEFGRLESDKSGLLISRNTGNE